jgi:FkbM family methyltransferase
VSRADRIKNSTVRQLRRRGIHIDILPPTATVDPDHRLDLRVEHVVAWHIAQHPDPGFRFVQVGAFDGNDHIHELTVRFGLAGIAVEPQKEQFAALQQTYSGEPQVQLRNVAISDRDCTREFYRVRPGMPAWTQQLASFDRENILRHDRRGRNLAENIISELVECVTFETLIGDDRCDLLQVDAEGFDAELVRLFDFTRWQPSIVQFEHRHLSLADHDDTLRHLVDFGYRVALSDGDSIAYRPH